MWWPSLSSGQLLPVDPQVAIDATKQLAEQFQTRFIATTVAIFVLQNVAWAVMHWRTVQKMYTVQEARVLDHKEGERRAEKLLDRMAVHMDRAAEATTVTNMILLGRTQSGEHPATLAPPPQLPDKT